MGDTAPLPSMYPISPVTVDGAAGSCAAPSPSSADAPAGPACRAVHEPADLDALSSASTPPPDASRCSWVPRKRACRAGARRVCISDASRVRYIASLCHEACEQGSGSGSSCEASPQAPRTLDEADCVEETKYIDGPAPEAVVVDQLCAAVMSQCDTAAVCPILKALVKTGAKELLSRVHQRLLCMDERVRRRGKILVLPSSTRFGLEACALIRFLRESVLRSRELVDKFQDRTCAVFAEVDASLDLERRNTAAALVLLGKRASDGRVSLT